ncbi:hypothetical protein CW362_26465 [Streptomyces populi]|uniref:Uncharacterized protein n=1 Tax=Streptomyces populi TaxID=2058924 RepID=A0A2I0SJE0_9ACTN|nr:hypothetical protein [Streptomyces populi]PKT70051.1 hypothetical protein CW362_26465 [Streptomyces populi]
MRTLRAGTEVRNRQVARAGPDVPTAAGRAATAVPGPHRDQRARPTASATAAVAVPDARFGTATARPGALLVQALARAVAGLACACVFLALAKSRAPHGGQPGCAPSRGPAPESGTLGRGE